MKPIKSMKDFMQAYSDETQRDQLMFEDCGGIVVDAIYKPLIFVFSFYMNI